MPSLSLPSSHRVSCHLRLSRHVSWHGGRGCTAVQLIRSIRSSYSFISIVAVPHPSSLPSLTRPYHCRHLVFMPSCFHHQCRRFLLGLMVANAIVVLRAIAVVPLSLAASYLPLTHALARLFPLFTHAPALLLPWLLLFIVDFAMVATSFS